MFVQVLTVEEVQEVERTEKLNTTIQTFLPNINIEGANISRFPSPPSAGAKINLWGMGWGENTFDGEVLNGLIINFPKLN